MTDDQFYSFVASCQNELAAKQAAFQARIQWPSRWHYEMAHGTLTIGDSLFSMTPIGTYNSASNSWLWAWANEDFPAIARAASARIQSLHTITGFRVFIDPGIKTSPKDPQDFTALAVHSLDAIGFFRCPSDGPAPALYLAVHETGHGTD